MTTKTRRTSSSSRPTPEHPLSPPRRRLAPEDREHQIVQKAIAFFAEHGFGASTRDLARVLGVAQPLLYRYFPTKDALIERIYEEVFVRRWNPEWEEWLANSSVPLADRLKRYFRDYADFVLRGEWVRIFIYAGLAQGDLNRRYLARLRERHFMVIAREMRREYDIPPPPSPEAEEEEIDLIWATHSGIFYIGVRKWIYGLPAPKNLDLVIDMRVDAFLTGVPAVLRKARLERAVPVRGR
jgi:AcrR family transcriptional regulator